jgi:iron complex transport system substrate-binding protein
VVVVDARSWHVVGGGIANVTRILQETARAVKR